MLNVEQIKEEIREKTVMEPKTIIFWGQDDMLVEAVDHLFAAKGGWKVIRVSDEWDADMLTREVDRVTPEALIVHESTISGNVRLLINFVRDCPKLKIILISLESNQLEIYNKHTIHIKEASDLLSIIVDDVVSDVRGGVSNP